MNKPCAHWRSGMTNVNDSCPYCRIAELEAENTTLRVENECLSASCKACSTQLLVIQAERDQLQIKHEAACDTIKRQREDNETITGYLDTLKASFNRSLLGAQDEVTRLRESMFNTASACRIWGGEAERARTMLEGYLSTPFDTSAIDALQRDAERYRFIRDFAHNCSCAPGYINACVSIKEIVWVEGQSSSEQLDDAIDAAIGASHE